MNQAKIGSPNQFYRLWQLQVSNVLWYWNNNGGSTILVHHWLFCAARPGPSIKPFGAAPSVGRPITVAATCSCSRQTVEMWKSAQTDKKRPGHTCEWGVIIRRVWLYTLSAVCIQQELLQRKMKITKTSNVATYTGSAEGVFQSVILFRCQSAQVWWV